MTWCPGDDCGRVMEKHYGSDIRVISCPCREMFCFQCGQNDHFPARCIQIDLWNELLKNANPNIKAIETFTKRCPGPNCLAKIDNNYTGCNHVTCKRCQHHYCWLCLGPWSEHTENDVFHSCTNYSDNE